MMDAAHLLTHQHPQVGALRFWANAPINDTVVVNMSRVGTDSPSEETKAAAAVVFASPVSLCNFLLSRRLSLCCLLLRRKRWPWLLLPRSLFILSCARLSAQSQFCACTNPGFLHVPFRVVFVERFPISKSFSVVLSASVFTIVLFEL